MPSVADYSLDRDVTKIDPATTAYLTSTYGPNDNKVPTNDELKALAQAAGVVRSFVLWPRGVRLSS